MPSQSFLDMLQDEAGKYLLGVIFTVLLALGFRIAMLINRGRMLRFFGISSSSPELCVYLSRLNVVKTTGIPKGSEEVQTGYQGAAVQYSELKGAIELRDLLKSRRVAVLPKKVRGLLGRQFISIAPVDPTIEPSPDMFHLNELPKHQNVICLGSHVYNSLFYVHNKQSRYFEFKRNEHGQRALFFKQGDRMEDHFSRERPGTPENRDREAGIIERVNDRERNRSIFYCAGLGSSATYGCVRYLVQNWEALYEEHGQEEFALYLVFHNQRIDDETVVTPEEPHYLKRGKKLVWWKRWL